MKPIKIGSRYNRLTILKDLGMVCGKRFVIAKCECGTLRNLPFSAIKNGSTKSCGCLQKELMSKRQSTHRLTKHPLYSVWANLKRRCYDETNHNYPRYGGVGVMVCEEWKTNFVNFYEWCLKNGWERGLQIDKDIIPKKLDIPALLYCPEYCSIVTAKENARARNNCMMHTYNSQTMGIIEWCEKFKKDYHLVRGRIYLGWSFEKAMDFI